MYLFYFLNSFSKQYTTIRRMHASLLVTLKGIDQRLGSMEQKHVKPPEGVQYQLLDPLLPLKDLVNIASLEELITNNNSALSEYVSIFRVINKCILYS